MNLLCLCLNVKETFGERVLADSKRKGGNVAVTHLGNENSVPYCNDDATRETTANPRSTLCTVTIKKLKKEEELKEKMIS